MGNVPVVGSIAKRSEDEHKEVEVVIEAPAPETAKVIRRKIYRPPRTVGPTSLAAHENSDDDEELSASDDDFGQESVTSDQTDHSVDKGNALDLIEEPNIKLGRVYAMELDQSDEFTALLTNMDSNQEDLNFLVHDPVNMDRFVRQTMYTLLKWLAGLRIQGVAADPDGAQKKTQITMNDLLTYVRWMGSDLYTPYCLRMERILNSAGLSIHAGSRQKFDPRVLAKIFTPVYVPTIKKCDCGDNCASRKDKALGAGGCPCWKPKKRRCTALCGCGPECDLRSDKFREDEEEEEEKNDAPKRTLSTRYGGGSVLGNSTESVADGISEGEEDTGTEDEGLSKNGNEEESDY
jgi:hypothetical protein